MRLDMVIFGAEETDKGKPIAGLCSANAMNELKTNTWTKDVRIPALYSSVPRLIKLDDPVCSLIW